MREPDADTDFDFDFFEEPSTQETAVRERPARRGPRRPMRPPPGVTPLLRLVGLIAFAILAVVVLVFIVQGCRDKSKTSQYSGYMNNVSQFARESESIGRELNNALTTPGIKEAALETKLNGLAQRQQQLVENAQGINSPGRLVNEQQAAVEALQFRVSGLRGLEDAFRSTAHAGGKDASAAGRLLAAQSERFVASDVVWDDLFKDPSKLVLKQQGVLGVQVPDSNFLVNPDLASATEMKAIWQRVHGARTGGAPGGLHGNGIVATKALPSGLQLSENSSTTIKATKDLSFEVTVEDSGQFQEVQVPVTLTIQRTPTPIVKKQTIDIISPGEQKTVTFTNLGEPPIATPTHVKVDVTPVKGETNTSNNTAEYPVIFSLA